MGRVDRVLFIENKTNYMNYISRKRPGRAGYISWRFYSPVKGKFFAKVYDAGHRAGAKFYHWGDIDIGASGCLRGLRNIIPSLKPYLMDKEAFCQKKSIGCPLAGNTKGPGEHAL